MPKAKERMTSYSKTVDGKKTTKSISCKLNYKRKCYNWFTVTRNNLSLALQLFENYWGVGDGHGFEFSFNEIDSQIKSTEKVLSALKKEMTKAKYQAMIKSKTVAVKDAKAKKAKDSKEPWEKAEKPNRLLG